MEKDKIGPTEVLLTEVKVDSVKDLRSVLDGLKDKITSGVIILGAVIDHRVSFICSVTPDLVQKGLHAGRLIQRVSQITGGGGGGRPDLAQAGGKDAERLIEALQQGQKLLWKS